MTVKRGPKWPWFSALRGPESGLAGKMKQIEAPNRGQNPKEYPRNLGNPPLPRAPARAFYGRKIGATASLVAHSTFAKAAVRHASRCTTLLLAPGYDQHWQGEQENSS